MKKHRILMGALALAMVAATVIACTKEKETKVAQQATKTEEVARKPIATYDNATGQMTYHFDLNKVQQNMRDDLMVRSEQDRYVVEAILIEDSIPAELSVRPELKIIVLDTEEEVSYTMWFMESFVDKVVSDNNTNYYKNAEVYSGVYEFGYHVGDAFYKINVNESEVTTTEVDSALCMGMIKWFFVCLQQNGCGTPCTKGGTFFNGYCNPCTTSPGQCNQSIAPWIVPAITVVGTAIIKWIFG